MPSAISPVAASTAKRSRSRWVRSRLRAASIAMTVIAMHTDQALDVGAVGDVVVPGGAQPDEQRRDDADDPDVARVAEQAADERGEDDEADEHVRRPDRDVEHGEQRRRSTGRWPA